MENKTVKDVFSIIEGKDGQSRWVKVGTAFINKDGSLNAFLDAFPKDGKLQIRDRTVNKTKAAS